jgi:hypothetical protein
MACVLQLVLKGTLANWFRDETRANPPSPLSIKLTFKVIDVSDESVYPKAMRSTGKHG